MCVCVIFSTGLDWPSELISRAPKNPCKVFVHAFKVGGGGGGKTRVLVPGPKSQRHGSDPRRTPCNAPSEHLARVARTARARSSKVRREVRALRDELARGVSFAASLQHGHTRPANIRVTPTRGTVAGGRARTYCGRPRPDRPLGRRRQIRDDVFPRRRKHLYPAPVVLHSLVFAMRCTHAITRRVRTGGGGVDRGLDTARNNVS